MVFQSAFMPVNFSPDCDGSFSRISTRTQIDGVVVDWQWKYLAQFLQLKFCIARYCKYISQMAHLTPLLVMIPQPSFDRTQLAIPTKSVPYTATLPCSSATVTMASKVVKLFMVVAVIGSWIPNHVWHNSV